PAASHRSRICHHPVVRLLGLCRYSCGSCDGGRTLLELAVSRLLADNHTHGTRQLLGRRGRVRRESLSRWEVARQSSLIIQPILRSDTPLTFDRTLRLQALRTDTVDMSSPQLTVFLQRSF